MEKIYIPKSNDERMRPSESVVRFLLDYSKSLRVVETNSIETINLLLN